jgi:hypothetical protein
MWVSVHELHELAFELDLLARVVGGAVRMMRIGTGGGQQHSGDDD